MSKFTIKPSTPSTPPTLVTLEESLEGQVDIMAHALDGESYRIAAIGDGKLHLFKMDVAVAERVGLVLDDGRYPHITWV